MHMSTMHASTMHPCTIFYLTTQWTRVSRSELGIIAERPSELASAGRLDVISNMERARVSIITAITAVTGTSPSPPLSSPLLIISITTFGNLFSSPLLSLLFRAECLASPSKRLASAAQQLVLWRVAQQHRVPSSHLSSSTMPMAAPRIAAADVQYSFVR